MPDLSVVIPVYNEEESLGPLWVELRDVLQGAGLDFEVVFVDDGSQDRSAEIIRGLREASPRVPPRVPAGPRALSRLSPLHSDAPEDARLSCGGGPGQSSAAPVRAVEVRNQNRAFVALADLLVVRWMKRRLLRYEIAEDLGGDLIRG